MSFFYDLNKKLNGLRAEDKQITESVAKAAAEVKTPARITLEESLKQDMKALMEGTQTQKDFDKLYDKAMSTPAGRAKIAKAEKSKDPHSINKAVGFKPGVKEDSSSKGKNLVKYVVFYDNEEDPRTGELVKVYEIVRLEALPERPNFFGENPKTVKKGIMDRKEADALAAKLNAEAGLAEDSVSKGKKSVNYSVFYDLVDVPGSNKIKKVYKVVKLEAYPGRPNFFSENPKVVKKGIQSRDEAQAIADELNAKVSEDGTGGMNFSGSGSLEEKAGYSAKKAAAGKDIGKPGKNFAKIEKSAGGGEKGKRIAGAVLNKLRHANENVVKSTGHPEGFEFPQDGRYGYAMGGGQGSYGGMGQFRSEGVTVYDKVSRKSVSIPDFTYMDEEPTQAMLKDLFYNPEGESIDESQINEIFMRGGDSIMSAAFNLNLFNDLIGENALTGDPEWKQSPKWMAVVKEFKPLALLLLSEIRAKKNTKLSDEDAEELDSLVYDGSDAYEGPEVGSNWLKGCYRRQAEALEQVLSNLSESGAGGIHGDRPDPMTAKDQQKKMNPPRSLEETDQDIMEFLRSKLGHAENHPYNKATRFDGKPDAYNGMEFEGMGGQVAGSIAGTMLGGPVGGAIGGAIGDKMTDEGNAFTGKLASTPKGGEFELDGEEYKDTSSLEETVSRKHFQQVADLLKNIPDEAKRKEMAMHHAHIFKQQNPRFDIVRFGQAAGVDLTECGMWEELKGGQKKLDKNHDGKLSAQDFAMLRGEEEVDEGFADMDAWLAQREKEKGTGRFDSRKVSTGTVYTRKPETFGDEEGEEGGEPAVKRGRGRPAKAKAPERVTGKAWKHKDGRQGAKHNIGGKMTEEGEEMVDEKAEAGKRHFFDKLAPAAKKVAKVVAKVTGEKKTEKEDTKAEKAGKKVAKDIEHDEGNKAKGDNKAEKAGKKVTKDIEYDDKKDKKADKKEEKVDETTTSGSVATASSSKKSSGMGIGQGIYDSWEREFETLLAESVSVKQEAMMDECGADGSEESITITATGDDVAKLKQALMAMGISHDAPAEEPHGDEACHSCGGVPCQCDDQVAGLPGELEIEVVEADAPVTANSPDYPTDQECSDDALQYSGGLNKPKSTGQTTIPVLASQEERQVAESNSFYSLVKAILVK